MGSTPTGFTDSKKIIEILDGGDDYGNSGCDTCDYGSDYGHTIQIYEPTKNVIEIGELVGTDLKK